MSGPDRLAAIRAECVSHILGMALERDMMEDEWPAGFADDVVDAVWRLAEVDRLRAEAARAHDLASRVMALEGEIARLTVGPYEVRACRGHFHITSGGHDIMNEWGDALDEETARKGAGELNARHHQTVEGAVAAALARRAVAAPTEETRDE